MSTASASKPRSQLLVGLVSLLILAAIVCAAIVGVAGFQARNADAYCQQTVAYSLDIDEDTYAVTLATGAWSWFPTGVVCDFPRRSGGSLITGATPSHVAFAGPIGVGAALAGVVIAVALFATRRRTR